MNTAGRGVRTAERLPHEHLRKWAKSLAAAPFAGTDSAGTGLGQRADFADPNAPEGLFTRLSPVSGLDPRTQTGPTRDLFRNPCPAGGVSPSNPNACVASAAGRQGNTARNAFRGPDFNSVDFSMIKRFPLGGEGRYKFTLRADFFNLFNRVNFGKPANTINSSNFGQSINTFRPRVIQFAGRFDF